MQADILDYFDYDPYFLDNKRNLENMKDSEFECHGSKYSVQELLKKNIIPKAKKTDTPIGVIFYGPPGSAKTSLSRAIAKEIVWDYIEINPGQFIEKGLDNIEQTTQEIFDRLYILEEVVILFDEFDELVRERELHPEQKGKQQEAWSRFITTSMLPKIQKLKEEGRKKIFIVGPNHVKNFDPAIKRKGRFDYLIPILYPKYEEKIDYIKDLLKGKVNPTRIKLFEEVLVKAKKKIDKIPETSLKEIIECMPYPDLATLSREIEQLLKTPDGELEEKHLDIIKYNYSYVLTYNGWKDELSETEPRIDFE